MVGRAVTRALRANIHFGKNRFFTFFVNLGGHAVSAYGNTPPPIWCIPMNSHEQIDTFDYLIAIVAQKVACVGLLEV